MKILFLTLASLGFAQVQRIEMTFEGVNCVPCVESMPARAMRIRGVASAKADAAKGVLSVELAPQNRVRVEQIRDLIQQDGTKAVSAAVEVSGTVEKGESGTLLLRIPQHPTPLELKSATIYEAGATVRVRGVIADLKRNPLLLVVSVQP
jgi:cation transport ATPase